MRSHTKKRQVVQADAAPRGESSYIVYITIHTSCHALDNLNPKVTAQIMWFLNFRLGKLFGQ